MLLWDDIKPILKKVLYKSPHPMFIWAEGSSQQFILTGATLYWSIKSACESSKDIEKEGTQVLLTQENIPLLFRNYFSSQKEQLVVPDKQVGETAFAHEKITINSSIAENEVDDLIKSILNLDYEEIHIQGSYK